jgi:hypothetical protein
VSFLADLAGNGSALELGVGTETFSSPHRYLWPSELDLMAKIAGMRLRERWSNWERDPFTSNGPMHVSMWEKSP